MSGSPDSPLKVVYMGTAELACPALRALAQNPRIHVQIVVTQPDRPRGRKLQEQPTPVKATALLLGLPVRQPLKARQPDFLQELQSLAPDLIVVAAYGQILPPTILDLPRFGCLNIHASLLPKYRGAAPIQWAILDGQSETGVTLMKMDPGLDTGPILAQEATPILPEDNASTLHDRLAGMGARLLLRILPDYLAGRVPPVPQPEAGSSYARKISKEDGLIPWMASAREIGNRVRAFTPWPGAYTRWNHEGRERLLKIWQAEPCEGVPSSPPGTVLQSGADRLVIACGDGALAIMELQMDGGKRLAAGAFLAGHPLREGEQLL